MYGLSLATAATALSTYQIGAAVGPAVGGFVAQGRYLDRIVAMCMVFAACVSLLLASAWLPTWGVLPSMALMRREKLITGHSPFLCDKFICL